ncbi:MAG: corrinoid protein [Candidatus Marinimicrobia bacterium]|nr:corrinoid protein [Candidatus Neomarinimicrobiota bacterium]MCF7827636.1 corrinoid protein [Candidatus Neomarinimicrobiota bacterium]MCF7881309.1 corrinoid protein [Candidatus Neomarinimicrobiota bacterium]
MDNESLLSQLAKCVEFGKVNKEATYPPDMQGKEGADELTSQALEMGIKPSRILDEALIAAMDRVGEKFSRKKIFVPQMLVAAKAMNAAMEHLKPYFQSGEVKRKGTFIIGTVSGDLHDIGKNLVAMIVEGAGWEVIDLGVDVSAAKFKAAIAERPDAVIGLSALLTTTMHNMKTTVGEIKQDFPDTTLLIGGAPVNEDFRKEIGAHGYSPDPQGAVSYLNSLAA